MFVELKTSTQLLAAEDVVRNEFVSTQNLTRSAAVVIATMVALAVLAFVGSSTAATVARFAVLILGIGAWIITQGWALELGDALRRGIGRIVAFLGQGEQIAGGLLTIIIILIVIWGLNKYRQSPADHKGALFIALLAGAMLFTASWARELALLYADRICVPIAEGFFYVFS